MSRKLDSECSPSIAEGVNHDQPVVDDEDDDDDEDRDDDDEDRDDED